MRWPIVTFWLVGFVLGFGLGGFAATVCSVRSFFAASLKDNYHD